MKRRTRITILAGLLIAPYAGVVLTRLVLERYHSAVLSAWVCAELQKPNWAAVQVLGHIAPRLSNSQLLQVRATLQQRSAPHLKALWPATPIPCLDGSCAYQFLASVAPWWRMPESCAGLRWICLSSRQWSCVPPDLLYQDVTKLAEIQAIDRGLVPSHEIDGSVLPPRGPSPAEEPEYVANLVRLLNGADDAIADRAVDSLAEYFCCCTYLRGCFAVTPKVSDRDRDQVVRWCAEFKGMTRRQILFARLQAAKQSVEEYDEETSEGKPDDGAVSHALRFVPEVLPRDEALDFLIDWATSGEPVSSRRYALFELYDMTELGLGGYIPDANMTTAVLAYWKQVRCLSHEDRTRFLAIGRLLIHRYDHPRICWRLSESEARGVFRRDEERSLELWRWLYNLAPAYGQPAQDEESRLEAAAERQGELLGVLARVNSPRCLALLRKIGQEHRSESVRDCVWELRQRLNAWRGYVMDEPADE